MVADFFNVVALLVVGGLRMRAAVTLSLSASNGFWRTALFSAKIATIFSLQFELLSFIYQDHRVSRQVAYLYFSMSQVVDQVLLS